jgi:hypothetical protein
MPQIPRVRTARKAGTCPVPGCHGQIWPGHKITKRPGGNAWQHEDCDNPGRRTHVPAIR